MYARARVRKLNLYIIYLAIKNYLLINL